MLKHADTQIDEQDIIDLTTISEAITEVVEELMYSDAYQAISKGENVSTITMDATQFKAIYDSLFALKVQISLLEMLEAEKRGEVPNIHQVAAKFGIDLKSAVSKNTHTYDQIIDETYSDVS